MPDAETGSDDDTDDEDGGSGPEDARSHRRMRTATG